MRFLTRSLVAVFLAALALGLLGLAAGMVRETLDQRAAQQARPRVSRERVFTARVVALRPGEVTPVLSTFGEVVARRTLELRAPTSGRILDLTAGFEEGEPVRAGQVLIRLDPAEAITARDLARSDLARAESELRDAQVALDLSRLDRAESEAQADLRRRAFERSQTLSQRGVGSATTVEANELAFAAARAAVISRRQAEAQAEARVSSARTALARQRITVAEAERRVRDTRISATFDGVLAQASAVVGGHVAANQVLAQVIDPASLDVAFRLSTAQYLRLLDPAGDLIHAPVRIALELGRSEIISPGVLSRASPSVGAGQSGRLVYAGIEAPRGFRPGDFVTVRITEPALQDVATVPASAVDGEGVVLVLGDEDRLAEERVEVVRRQGDQVLIRVPEALSGREIVAARTPLLGAGIKVRPQREGGAQAAPESGSEPGSAPESARESASESASGPASAMVALDAATRARLIARVEAAPRMPESLRNRILSQLGQDRVPARLVERLQQAAGPRQGG